MLKVERTGQRSHAATGSGGNRWNVSFRRHRLVVRLLRCEQLNESAAHRPIVERRVSIIVVGRV